MDEEMSGMTTEIFEHHSCLGSKFSISLDNLRFVYTSAYLDGTKMAPHSWLGDVEVCQVATNDSNTCRVLIFYARKIKPELCCFLRRSVPIYVLKVEFVWSRSRRQSSDGGLHPGTN
jgi:hypothetical protein